MEKILHCKGSQGRNRQKEYDSIEALTIVYKGAVVDDGDTLPEGFESGERDLGLFTQRVICVGKLQECRYILSCTGFEFSGRRLGLDDD